MNIYDICIIGGGAAGMMAAFSARAHHKDATICIVDRTFELGRKLLVAGAGRGNLTNVHVLTEGVDHFYGNAKFIQEVFSQYTGEQITSFFEEHGIPLYEEQKTGKGKLFPTIDNAKTVRDILIDELLHIGVDIYVDTEVVKMTHEDNKWNIQTNKETIIAKNCILACGGTTYPSLGANGSGYALAERIGHTIVEPVPSAVPLVSKNKLSHFLQGEKVRVELQTASGKTSVGDVLFTQYGISGSAVLDISRDISIQIHREHQLDIPIYLSFFPRKSKTESSEIIEHRLETYADRPVSRSLWGLVTTKVANAICVASNIEKSTIARALTEEEKNTLIQTLTHYEVRITGTRGWNEAEFTSGGVSTDEVDARTLASKKAPHMYIAGELLDVDGDIGGFNLSWAWASGWVAGKCLSA